MNTVKTGRIVAKLAAAALFAATCQAQAAELLVTPAVGKGGAMNVALDLVSEGDVTAFNFTVNLGNGHKGSAKLGSCVADLPKSFTAECRQNGSKIVFFAIANGMQTLPAGVTSIGTISFASGAAPKGGAGNLTIEEAEFVDLKGTPINSTTRIER